MYARHALSIQEEYTDSSCCWSIRSILVRFPSFKQISSPRVSTRLRTSAILSLCGARAQLEISTRCNSPPILPKWPAMFLALFSDQLPAQRFTSIVVVFKSAWRLESNSSFKFSVTTPRPMQKITTPITFALTNAILHQFKRLVILQPL